MASLLSSNILSHTGQSPVLGQSPSAVLVPSSSPRPLRVYQRESEDGHLDSVKARLCAETECSLTPASIIASNSKGPSFASSASCGGTKLTLPSLSPSDAPEFIFHPLRPEADRLHQEESPYSSAQYSNLWPSILSDSGNCRGSSTDTGAYVMASQRRPGNLLTGSDEETVTSISDNSEASIDDYIRGQIQIRDLEDAFYIIDLASLERLYDMWTAALPRVTPFYAVKCNPNPAILALLEALGAGFDCASWAELRQVLGMGVAPERIIFANPCKMPSHLRYAESVGVTATTFDSEAELVKIQQHHPGAQLLLRIQTKDSGARCPLGSKYGALPGEVGLLLDAAAARGLAVCGVSFHIGSAASDPLAYHSAIAAAHGVFREAAMRGRPLHVLDIGGGFTAGRHRARLVAGLGASSGGGRAGEPTEPPGMSFLSAARAVNTALDEFFPAGCGVRVIAEPGRYFAEAAATLATRVFGKRTRGVRREYWVNDGLYGSMNCLLYDHAELSARPLRLASLGMKPAADCTMPAEETGQGDGVGPAPVLSKSEAAMFPSTVFGPTCDGLDVVFKYAELPELEVGDWLVFPDMGAYTAAAGSSFNGFLTPELRTLLVWSETDSYGTQLEVPGREEQQQRQTFSDWSAAGSDVVAVCA